MATRAVDSRPGAPTRFALWYIDTYRTRLAPRFADRSRCHFDPSCSAYGLECYRRYGFARATAKTVWRIMRCHPFRRATGIVDPA